MDLLSAAWPAVMDAVDRIVAQGGRATQSAIEVDERLRRGRTRAQAREMIPRAAEQGWLLASGETSGRHFTVTRRGFAGTRAVLSGVSCRKEPP